MKFNNYIRTDFICELILYLRDIKYTLVCSRWNQTCREYWKVNNNVWGKIIVKNNVDCVRYLLTRKGVDPSANNNQAIKLASLNGSRMKILELLLLDSLVNPSVEENYPLRCASEFGLVEIVKRLLQDPRVNPSANDNRSIQIASRKGHTEIVELLLKDPRVNPSANDNRSIQIASAKGHTEIVKILLEDPRVNPSANKKTLFGWIFGMIV